MSELPFEERYEDVLQNIEFGIVRVYREHPEMTDWETLNAIGALLHTYRAEAKGRQPAPPSLAPLAQEVYESVEAMCEWRLGRETPFLDEEGEPAEFPVELITLDEIIACLIRSLSPFNPLPESDDSSVLAMAISTQGTNLGCDYLDNVTFGQRLSTLVPKGVFCGQISFETPPRLRPEAQPEGTGATSTGEQVQPALC
ncbi:MAG: hypothetical protein ACE5OS_12460 [Anaerolineae bacterium]